MRVTWSPRLLLYEFYFFPREFNTFFYEVDAYF